MTRDGKFLAIFSAITVVAGGTVATHLSVAEPPPAPAIVRDVSMGSDSSLSVQFLGDTMLGDGAQDVIDTAGYDWPLAEVAPALDGDYVIANVESPITVITEPYNPGKKYSYAAHPASAGALARAGVDAVGLANNHAMDAGPPGLAQTFDSAQREGLTPFGAGRDMASAEQPLLLRSDVGTVGVVALGENFGRQSRADVHSAGMVVLSPRTVQRGVDLARAAGADWVVAYVHWGDNYASVNDQQRYWAQMLVDAGYDMVVGTGPHVAQPIEVVDSVPVAYSLGNFVFGSPGRFESYGVPGHGLVLKVDLSRSAAARLSVRCLLTDNEVVGYRPRPCNPGQAAVLLPAYAPDFTVESGVGVLTCSCFAREEQG